MSKLVGKAKQRARRREAQHPATLREQAYGVAADLVLSEAARVATAQEGGAAP